MGVTIRIPTFSSLFRAAARGVFDLSGRHGALKKRFYKTAGLMLLGGVLLHPVSLVGTASRFFYGTIVPKTITLAGQAAHKIGDMAGGSPAKAATPVNTLPSTPTTINTPITVPAIGREERVEAKNRALETEEIELPSTAHLNVPPRLDSAIKNTTDNSIVPYEMMVLISGAESNFRNANNPKSSACGTMQLLGDSVLPELLYKYGARDGHEKYLPYVSRVTVKNKEGKVLRREFRPNAKNKNSVKMMAQACNSPQVASDMANELMQEIMITMERGLGRRINYTDVYIGYFAGQGKGLELLKLYDNPKTRDYKAADYVDAGVAARNRPYFYDANGRPRSIEGMYDFLADKRGITKTLLPSILDRSVTINTVETDTGRKMVLTSPPTQVASLR